MSTYLIIENEYGNVTRLKRFTFRIVNCTRRRSQGRLPTSKIAHARYCLQIARRKVKSQEKERERKRVNTASRWYNVNGGFTTDPYCLFYVRLKHLC